MGESGQLEVANNLIFFFYPQALGKLCHKGLICSWDFTVVAIKKKTNRNSRAEVFLNSGGKSRGFMVGSRALLFLLYNDYKLSI